LYNEEDWSKYFATDYEGNVTHRPIKGEAVAPCALKAFVDADKEINDSLNLEVNARREAIEAEAAERKASDAEIHEELDAHNTRLSHLEAEVEGKVSEVENEMGFSGSRLDRIEAAIGINHHHCENCGCDHQHCTCEDNKCSCSDADNKCTIYCRLNDAEKDREELNEAIFSIDKRLVAKAERLDLIEAAIGINHHHCENCGCEHEHCTCEDDKCSCSDADNKCTIYCRLNDIEDDLETHMDTLEEHRSQIENNAEDIARVDANLDEEILRSTNKDEELYNHIQRIDGNIKRIDTNIETTNQKVASNRSEIERVENKVDAEIVRSIGEDARIEGLLENEVNTRKDLSKYVYEDLAEDVRDSKNRINGLEVSRESTNDTINGHAAKINTIQSDLTDINATISRHYEEFYGEKNKIDNDISQNTSDISVLKEYINHHVTPSILDVQNQVTNNTESIASLRTKDNELSNDITKNASEITKINSSIEITNSRIEMSESRISSLEVAKAELEAKAERIDSNNTAINGLISDLSAVENRLTNVEDSNEKLHHLTSQTQFAVRTTIPAEGSKTIKVSDLIGPASNEWDLVQISSVTEEKEIDGKKVFETIYPEIIFGGEVTNDKDDNRYVTILFEHDLEPSIKVVLIVSAFKASQHRIIEIN
jgi:chromosome segregation ATPase